MRRGRIGGLLLAIAFMAFVFYSLLHTEPVKVLHPAIQHDVGGEFLAAAVENTSTSEQSIDLDIKYYDTGGHLVANDTIHVDHLSSGETREVAAPARQLPDGTSYSVYLNHGRNPYGN
ncbi:MAG TPA: FxLYD domain-containing protein [Candidatus Binataceae bacterium]|nr:FxLYD domain-containing protein [Candidatus Binataceae bacterium]